MAGHRRDEDQQHDDERRTAHWTQAEKKRVMATVTASENRAVFLSTCKRILYTSSTILAALAAIKLALGDYWAAIVVAFQQGPHH